MTMGAAPDVYTWQCGSQGRNGAPTREIPPNVQELLLHYKECKL
jgi:hypothetical protein